MSLSSGNIATELETLPRTSTVEARSKEFHVGPEPEPQSSLVKQIFLLLRSEMISGPWRRPVGLVLLFTTITLWTVSGFLASSIFADAEFSKPYFVTYFNISFFILPLLPFAFVRGARRARGSHQYHQVNAARKDSTSSIPGSPRDGFISGGTIDEDDDLPPPVRRRSFGSSVSSTPSPAAAITSPATQHLSTQETFWLSTRFCVLWFISNYFNAASLQYTTVASTTILSSTSSVFTLIMGALWGVEKFNWRKLAATLTCLLGVFIISRADTREEDGDRGTFPYKTPAELLLGDAMALLAAFLYGFYAVAFVKTVGDESRVKMPMFFGFIGLVSTLLMWPGMAVLHWTGIEPFELPPNAHVWVVIVINSVSSLVADIAWAYSLLFISPLVVTVGLSICIPLSLIGQMVLDSQYASPLYWFGALIVVFSFVFINFESKPLHQPEQVSNEAED